MNEKDFKSVMANIVRANTKRLETIEAHKNEYVCVYCLGLTTEMVCYTCNEYKSLMPVNLDTEKYLKEMDISLVEILEG